MVGFDSKGCQALEPGAARELGAGMARALAAGGAAVMVGDVLDDEGRAMAQSLTASGATASFVRLDVRDEAQWVAAVEATCRRWAALTF